MSNQERSEADKLKNAEAYLKFRQKYIDTETEEQRKERLARLAAVARKNRKAKFGKKYKDTETPEQRKERLARLAAYARYNRRAKLNKETPEQTAERRARDAQRMRLKRQQHQPSQKDILRSNLTLAERRALETPEETERRLKKLECIRNYRRKKKLKEDELRKQAPEMDRAQRLAQETPEEANRRLRRTECAKRYYQKRKATLKAEEIEARRLKSLQQMRKTRKRIGENETPEKANERRAREAEYSLSHKQRKRAQKQWKGVAKQNTVNSIQKYWEMRSENDGSCTSSSFKETDCTNKEITSRTSTIQDDGPVQVESLSSFERDNIKSEKNINLLEANWPKSNKHLEYLASICEMIRTRNLNKSEIAVAKRLIDKILLNLSMGKYNNVNSDKSIVPTIEQTVIIKEEVDL